MSLILRTVIKPETTDTGSAFSYLESISIGQSMVPDGGSGAFEAFTGPVYGLVAALLEQDMARPARDKRGHRFREIFHLSNGNSFQVRPPAGTKQHHSNTSAAYRLSVPICWLFFAPSWYDPAVCISRECCGAALVDRCLFRSPFLLALLTVFYVVHSIRSAVLPRECCDALLGFNAQWAVSRVRVANPATTTILQAPLNSRL